MKKIDTERRRYARYDTKMKIYYQVKYDIRTRVTFKIIDSKKPAQNSKEYSGVSKNISVEGLCFSSPKLLNPGDILIVNVYTPNVKEPVRMEGEVRWSEKLAGEAASDLPQPESEGEGVFYTGVKLTKINNQPVAESIHYDNEYKVIWSAVLESVFSSFIAMSRRLKEESGGKDITS